jgi:hypothetical protein
VVTTSAQHGCLAFVVQRTTVRTGLEAFRLLLPVVFWSVFCLFSFSKVVSFGSEVFAAFARSRESIEVIFEYVDHSRAREEWQEKELYIIGIMIRIWTCSIRI